MTAGLAGADGLVDGGPEGPAALEPLVAGAAGVVAGAQLFGELAAQEVDVVAGLCPGAGSGVVPAARARQMARLTNRMAIMIAAILRGEDFASIYRDFPLL